MASVLSTFVVVRVVGTYMSVALFNDTNVMFADEMNTYYLLSIKFIIDLEKDPIRTKIGENKNVMFER